MGAEATRPRGYLALYQMNSTAAELDQLAEEGNTTMRRLVAVHANTSPETLLRLCKSSNFGVQGVARAQALRRARREPRLRVLLECVPDLFFQLQLDQVAVARAQEIDFDRQKRRHYFDEGDYRD